MSDPESKKKRRTFTKEERAMHSVIEKQRREALNDKFTHLAHMLPQMKKTLARSSSRPSKASVVKNSIEHIEASNGLILESLAALRVAQSRNPSNEQLDLIERLEAASRDILESRERVAQHSMVGLNPSPPEQDQSPDNAVPPLTPNDLFAQFLLDNNLSKESILQVISSNAEEAAPLNLDDLFASPEDLPPFLAGIPVATDASFGVSGNSNVNRTALIKTESPPAPTLNVLSPANNSDPFPGTPFGIPNTLDPSPPLSLDSTNSSYSNPHSIGMFDTGSAEGEDASSMALFKQEPNLMDLV